MDSLYQFTKNDLKIAKIAKLGYMSSIVYYLLPWKLVMWFCKDFLFLDQVIQELYSKYDAMNWLLQITKIAKNWSQNG